MNNELMHYGIPGTKWGVRKDKPSYRSTRFMGYFY